MVWGKSARRSVKGKQSRHPHHRTPGQRVMDRVRRWGIEGLEPRVLLAAVWEGLGDGTSWSDPMNWSGNSVPGFLDDVVIDVEANPTIRIGGQGLIVLRSLTSREAMEIGPDARVTLTGSAQVDNTLTLNGVTLDGGSWTVSGPGVVVTGAATLTNVTLDADVTVNPEGYLAVYGGSAQGTIRLNGSAEQSADLTIDGDGAETLLGNSQIISQGNPNNEIYINALLGAGITIRGEGRLHGPFNSVRLVNRGAIVADQPGRALRLTSGWTNQGTLRAENGGVLRLEGTFTSADMGTYDARQGAVSIGGTLDNTGRTLAVTAATGPLTVGEDGTIRGGTITTSGASLLGGGGYLDGVTFSGDLDIGTGKALRVLHGLTLDNGTIRVHNESDNSRAWLFLVGAQTISGTGQLVLSGEYATVGPTLPQGSGPAAVTFGPNIVVRGDGSLQSQAENLTLVNEGQFIADVPGKVLSIDVAGFQNDGLIAASNGGILGLDGTIRIGASGSFDARQGVIRIYGVLDNTGSTLQQTPETGLLTLAGGTIRGGTITFPGDTQLDTPNGTLDGVTLGSNLTITNGELTIRNGLTVNATLTLGSDQQNGGALTFDGTQTLAGTGRLVLTDGWVTLDAADRQPMTLTVGSLLTIEGPAGIGPTANTLRNHGTLTVASIRVGDLINEGAIDRPTTLEVGGNLSIDGQGWLAMSETGTLTVRGSISGSSQNTQRNTWNTALNLTGNLGDPPRNLEVMSRDLGATAAGYAQNFAWSSLRLGTGTRLQLINQNQNIAGSNNANALYVGTLIVESGATLDLHGLYVYARSTQIAGQVIGGTIDLVPGGGELSWNVPTPGTIANGGVVDEWTFAGLAGESVEIVVNPSGWSQPRPVEPYLNSVTVRLVGPDGAELISDSASGQLLSLPAVELPASGTYKVLVGGGDSFVTGNYVITSRRIRHAHVVEHAPLGSGLAPIDNVRFTFSRTMDTSSFSLQEDIVSFTGPNGPIVASGFRWVDSTTLEVSFPPQTTVGGYQMVLSPQILNVLGNPLDQDENDIGGEAVADTYTGLFRIDGLRIESQMALTWVPGLPSYVAILFNHDVDPATFSLDDIVSATGPGGAATVTSFNWVNPRTLQLFFPQNAPLGNYAFTLGTEIRDVAGNGMDQDGDSIVGEPLDDLFTATFVMEGLRVISHAPLEQVAGAFSYVRLKFNYPVHPSSFSLDDVSVAQGPSGPIAITSYEWIDDRTLELRFATQTELGTYTFTLGPDIRDIGSGAMDQDVDRTAGEAGQDAYTANIGVSLSGTLSGHVVLGPEHGPLVVKNLIIPAGASLTLRAGTILKFVDDGDITVEGALYSNGTVQQPVILTSIHDDSAGGDTDGHVQAPQYNAWKGLFFKSDGSVLQGFDIRYAGCAVNADFRSAQVVLKNGSMRYGGYGVYVYQPYVQIEAENVLIANNAYTGVFVRADSRHVFRNATIVGNGLGGGGEWGGWDRAGIHQGGANLTLENSIVAYNGVGYSHFGDPPTINFRNSIFFNANNIYWEDFQVAEPNLNANGNRIIDPMFVNWQAGNFELAAGSPAIDSGTGLNAPTTDLLGRPRCDDRGMPNVGAGYPSFVDLGAFERQQNTATADLAVTGLSGPSPLFVAAGGSVTVQWTVTNLGTAAANGPWKDRIYLSSDPYYSVDDTFLAEYVNGMTLNPGGSYTQSITAAAAGSGPRYVLVRTNAQGSLVEASAANNVLASSKPLGVNVPTLSVGSPLSGGLNQGEWQFIRLDATPGNTIILHLNAGAARGESGLYVRYGLPPTQDVFDASATVFDSPDQELRILAPRAGTYYIGIFGEAYPGFASTWQLSASLANLGIGEVSPSEAGNGGTITLKISGDHFDPDTQVRLTGPGGKVLLGSVYYGDASTLYATFYPSVHNAPAGDYDLTITKSGASTTKPAAVRLTEGGQGSLSAKLIVPGTARPNRKVQVTLKYTNVGTVDLPSPLFVISTNVNTLWQLPGGDRWTNWGTQVLGLSSDGPATILRPGQSESITLICRTPLEDFDAISYKLDAYGRRGDSNSSKPLDWTALEPVLRPLGASDNAWTPVFARIKAQVGNTWGDYVTMLRQNAEHLGTLGQRIYDPAELFGFELQQAGTVGSPAVLQTEEDLRIPSTGLPFSFIRSFTALPAYRARIGAMGRGWRHNFEITAQRRSDGAMVVRIGSGAERLFTSAGSGVYKPAGGGMARLVYEDDGTWRLNEPTGLSYHFNLDGRFDSITDANNNRINATYDAEGRLAEVTNSAGDRFAFQYDDNFRLTTVTDSLGRQITYGYDQTGDHLTSVTGYDQQNTQYDYITGINALKNHNLASVTRPGGLVVTFTYDNLGRLIQRHIGAGLETVRWTYDDAGKTVETDALNRTTTSWIDSAGRVARTQNALGEVWTMAYDSRSNLVAVTAPGGLSWQYEYDEAGNLTLQRDALGNAAAFGYGGNFGELLWSRDALGNTTSYSYDADGNLASIGWSDGTSESYVYDDAGNRLSLTNRRGNVISYTRNARGQITSRSYEDGSSASYEYDARGRLTSVTDPSGVTTLEYYDDDRLKKITYASGQWLAYTYDALGRRRTTNDQTGRTLTYHYDIAGRLERITDSTNAQIVTYAYNLAGQISRQTLGNGAYSTSEYDAAGRLSILTNYAADNTRLSRFEYGYDALSRRVSATTLDGVWTYEYDDAGQLTRAVFTSTNPNIADQDLRYEYDAAGNRKRTIANGVTTDYQVNGLNQYTQVGDTTYLFDADGNLIQANSPAGATTYTYDDENRLTGVARGADTWSYVYDGLGNRVSSTHNGVTTHYVTDPVGLGNLVGEYDANGGLLARYDHGYTLLSATSAGQTSYYSFDGSGNVATLTNAAGALAGQRVDDPFGNGIFSSGSAAGVFGFLGAYGLSGESNGLVFGRARYYDPALGRYVSTEPLRLPGDGLYLYASNDPIGHADANGLLGVGTVADGLEVGAELAKAGHLSGELGAQIIGASKVAGPIGKIADGIELAGDWVDYYKASDMWAHNRLETAELFMMGARCVAKSVLLVSGIPFAGDVADFVYDALGGPKLPGDTKPEDANKKFWDEVPDKWWIDNYKTDIYTSLTPEDKWGPAGYDAPETPANSLKRYVVGDQAFNYRVEIWNKPDAVVPTQDATIYDVLDPNLFDLSTFQFTRVGFLKWDVVIPGTRQLNVRIDCRGVSPGDMNLIVDITGTLNTQTGRIDWWFHAIDPLTGESPDDPSAGFLPPYNPLTGYEIGWVEYTVNLKPNLPTGTSIPNQAFVQFDFLGPLGAAPKPDPWVNTIDAGAPSSQVAAMLPTFNPQFTVSWAGQDDLNGSGVANYDVYVSDNGGAFTLWLDRTTDTSALFTGVVGHTYSFYSVARDNVGNMETAPLVADATISVRSPNTVQFKAAKFTVAEKTKIAYITLVRSGPTDLPVTVWYATTKGSASSKNDYKSVYHAITFAPGQSKQIFSVTIYDDKVLEYDETIGLMLYDPGVGAALGKLKTATLTILANDDYVAPVPKLYRLAAPKKGAAAYDFSVTYTDGLAVTAASLGTGDVWVTGPNRFSQIAKLVAVKPAIDAKSIIATYRIVPPGKTWDAADDGAYAIWLQGKQVWDTSKNLAAKQQLGTLTVKFGTAPAAARASRVSTSAAERQVRTVSSPETLTLPRLNATAFSARLPFNTRRRIMEELTEMGDSSN